MSEAVTASPPYPLYFFPDYSRANPYQTMLHSRLGEADAYPVPVTHLVAHLRNQVANGGDPGVLNLHWTSPILQRAPGPFRAKLLLDRFTSALDDYLAAGGRLVWTIHNVLPHDAKHRWAEVELAQFLADRADVVHLLSLATLDAVGDLYRIDPAKLAVIKHSSYLGYYPDEVTRADARDRLGISPDDTVLVALGGIRPYKGLDTLLDAFDELVPEDPSLRLLVAGAPIADPLVDALRERCGSNERVTARFAHVADDDLQIWMNAADLAVLPYRDILNSGAFLLAQTFRLPVVGPRSGSLLSWEDQPQVTLFEPSAPGSLTTAIRDALALVRADPEGQRGHASSAAHSRTPEAMAGEYARAIAPLLQPRSGTAPTA